MTTFLILGGTGKTGRRLARTLTGGGHVVRAAGRSTTPRFDWHDRSTWATALTGVDGVFVVGPGSATDWSPLLSDFLATAAERGVRHAVLLSARGVEFLPDGVVARAEAALQAGPVAWTILRPSHFAQNFTEAMFVPDADGRIVAPVGSGAEPFVDVQDIAEVAAAVLRDPATWAGQVLALSGPAALTFDEAAAVLSEAAGAPVRFEDEADDAHERRLAEAGTPAGYIPWRAAMLRGIRRGEDAYLSDGVERVLGRGATSFQEWARREVPAR
ncbi:NmrA family NAD(P)-binding protein [Myceligenerans indicum]|uniref:NmrA family NAD(P)-binding protein n=1 Tax=Myceligenerans indicum TaxID=2593663 RepID=A0ABS1LHU7_9MICO|nr:NmrA family NAD(P)-binding protein [Myceligenerans indicum]MBL0885796.1 NmrA family NAD(P)-binding protein [Myceligenerans indicum]